MSTSSHTATDPTSNDNQTGNEYSVTDHAPAWAFCQECNGDGEVEATDEHGYALSYEIPCPSCNGSGVDPSYTNSIGTDAERNAIERQTLAAMVSELMAESVRVSKYRSCPNVCVTYNGNIDSVRVEACTVEWHKDVDYEIDEHFFLADDDAADKLADLIKRVSALGA